MGHVLGDTNAAPTEAGIPVAVWVGLVFVVFLVSLLLQRARKVRAPGATVSPLNSGIPAPKSLRVPAKPVHALRRVLLPLFVQAVVWSALTVAFATLLVISGPQNWANALHFAAVNWMPWAGLAPVVFWFSGRFPLERGHWWKSVPAHLFGCVTCVGLTLWVAMTFSYQPRRSGPNDDRRPPIERESPDHVATATDHAAVLPQPPPPRHDDARRGSGFGRGDRGERFARGESLTRRGPFWWPMLGAMLMRANFDVAVYLIVVVAAHALAFYRRAQERERHAVALAAGLNRAKLDALRLQLQPHFLFNTLNAISTLVHRDATAADELIGDLSDLLRLSLQTSDHEVPLARELELLDRYLAIEQTRLGDRLQIIRDIEPAATAAYVPTFALQPLVENAIRHGIEPRAAPGTISLRARRSGDFLELTVGDNGVGLRSKNAQDARRGIGISNTEHRLRALHGDGAKLTLTSPAGGGVEVRITLPFSTRPRGDAPEDGASNEAKRATSNPKPDDGDTLGLLMY